MSLVRLSSRQGRAGKRLPLPRRPRSDQVELQRGVGATPSFFCRLDDDVVY